MDDNQANKFRSLQEVKRYLDEQTQKLREHFQVIDFNISQLSAMLKPVRLKALEIKVMDFSGDSAHGGKPVKRKTINTDFPIVKVPNKTQLIKNYREAEKLSQQYKSLVQNEAEVRMTFRNATNVNFQSLMSNFTKLKNDIEKKLRELFKVLNNIAEGHAPKEYKNFVKGLADELNDEQHIECDNISNFTYVGVTTVGDLLFAGYIVLTNAMSDEGKLIPHLYIAVRWVVSGEDSGKVDIFVEHDFVEPSLLSGGMVVENLKDAVKVITNQLSLEGFSSQIGNLPIKMQLKDPSRLNKEAFSAGSRVKSIDVDHEHITFNLVKGISASELEEISNQLFVELKSILRNKRNAKLRMRRNIGKIEFFISNLDQSSGVTPYDLEFLKEKYKLSDQVLRKVANEINNGG